MGSVLVNSLEVLQVTSWTFPVANSMTRTSWLDDLRGFERYTSNSPSGDQRGCSSEMSGVLVRLTTSPFSVDTANRSHCSLPS